MIPRESLLDILWAVATFAMSFFYIVIIWMVHSRFFDDYPLYDEVFLGLNFVMLFLVVISPFLSQSIFFAPALREEASLLLAVDMMGIYIILGILHQRARVFLWTFSYNNILYTIFLKEKHCRIWKFNTIWSNHSHIYCKRWKRSYITITRAYAGWQTKT